MIDVRAIGQEHIGKCALYLSLPWVWSVTSFPKTRAEAACSAFWPYDCPFSGQSMPLRRIRSGCWLCRTSMVVAVIDADNLGGEVGG